MFEHYGSPPGFNYDVLYEDTPFVTNKNLGHSNAEEKARDFHRWIMNQAQHYRSETDLFVVMGSDFTF